MFFRGQRPLIDHPTQVLVLYAAVNLGLIGFFKFDSLHWLLGRWEVPGEYVIGLSGVWQVLRQRW
jgi:uncharacterized membrane protein YuzA (DUF378 family)